MGIRGERVIPFIWRPRLQLDEVRGRAPGGRGDASHSPSLRGGCEAADVAISKRRPP